MHSNLWQYISQLFYCSLVGLPAQKAVFNFFRENRAIFNFKTRIFSINSSKQLDCGVIYSFLLRMTHVLEFWLCFDWLTSLSLLLFGVVCPKHLAWVANSKLLDWITVENLLLIFHLNWQNIFFNFKTLNLQSSVKYRGAPLKQYIFWCLVI